MVTPRLERRIRRDFGGPERAQQVLDLLAELPATAGYDPAMFSGERVQAAIVLWANGSLRRVHDACKLAETDWRDMLVAAGLADADWPQRLDEELAS